MDTNSNVERGVSLAREGLYTAALQTFDEDFGFAQDPVAMSYYAVCLAAAEGHYDKAVSLCLVAAEKEFYSPDIYLNLGKIFLLSGQKSVAIRAFKKGLRFDTAGGAIMREIKTLGLRRKSVLPFLPRHNVVNRLLGRFTRRHG